MRILVACEESQTVCAAFLELDKGHDVWSCDLQESSGEYPERHIQDDVLKHLDDGWDMMIGHPDCTYLANSGVSWLWKEKERNEDRWAAMKKGADFFNVLNDADIEQIALENPIPHKYAKLLIGGYDQLIHPYHFGVAESKATCLWLKNLPPLMHTIDARYAMSKRPKKDAQRIHYMSPGPERSKERSKTFPAIAHEMARQWG